MSQVKLELSQIRFFSLVLRIVANAPSGKMRVNQIIELGLKSKWLTHFERENVTSRTDSRFANHIHNIVSHRESKKNPINANLIIWHNQTEEFEMSQNGWKFLNDVNAKLFAAHNPVSVPTGAKNFEALDVWLRQYVTE
jgi:hypothetical protein